MRLTGSAVAKQYLRSHFVPKMCFFFAVSRHFGMSAPNIYSCRLSTDSTIVKECVFDIQGRKLEIVKDVLSADQKGYKLMMEDQEALALQVASRSLHLAKCSCLLLCKDRKLRIEQELAAIISQKVTSSMFEIGFYKQIDST
jgi:hypothetical protein